MVLFSHIDRNDNDTEIVQSLIYIQTLMNGKLCVLKMNDIRFMMYVK